MSNDQAAAKQQAINQLKSRAIKGVVSGAGIATGVAAGESLLTVGATAAETAAVAVETVAVLPTLLTIAAVGGTCYGIYKICEALSDS